jgi:hypothetical protein
MNGSFKGNMSKVKSFVKKILCGVVCGVPWLGIGGEKNSIPWQQKDSTLKAGGLPE